MLDSLREVVRNRTTVEERLRAALGAYLETFADKPHAAYLWFEYWVAVGRRGNTAAITSMLADVEAFLDELLPGEAQLGARDVLSWLLGTVVQQQARPRSAADLDAELDRFVRVLAG
ncbi:hypothetical protein [Actinomycetospora termitidis]|uniref:TetR family transcriptional regulator n=1 Tax=Actinomycetospora termitidis TaxID=3053470 RepID=A0ABT7M138_9PSEU|nr:hypothetical protein [Actinomycetospora sp. Odt1-22]MDL5154360.1 hypothetical protein [Actinomycetospora sp. Odt1-22]